MAQSEEIITNFLSQMDAQKETLLSEIQFSETLRENELNYSNAFKQKLAESQKKFKSDRISMEKTFKQLNLENEKFKKNKQICENELETLTRKHITQLSDQETVCVEKPIGNLLESVMTSMNNLSVKSMDTQLFDISTNLKVLNDEKTTRSKNLENHNAVIKNLETELKSSYDVAYAERNVLKFSMSHQTSTVRRDYQKIRLQEESLKAKLGS